MQNTSTITSFCANFALRRLSHFCSALGLTPTAVRACERRKRMPADNHEPEKCALNQHNQRRPTVGWCSLYRSPLLEARSMVYWSSDGCSGLPLAARTLSNHRDVSRLRVEGEALIHPRATLRRCRLCLLFNAFAGRTSRTHGPGELLYPLKLVHRILTSECVGASSMCSSVLLKNLYSDSPSGKCFGTCIPEDLAYVILVNLSGPFIEITELCQQPNYR